MPFGGVPVVENQQITNNYLSLPDLLRGKVGVADGVWDTAPTNLTNPTDGDIKTASGTGSKNVAGVMGSVKWDLESIQDVYLAAKFGTWTTTTAVNLFSFVYYSEDDVNYYNVSGGTNALKTISQTSEQFVHLPLTKVRCRYIKAQFSTASSIVGNAKIYEINAFKV